MKWCNFGGKLVNLIFNLLMSRSQNASWFRKNGKGSLINEVYDVVFWLRVNLSRGPQCGASVVVTAVL